MAQLDFTSVFQYFFLKIFCFLTDSDDDDDDSDDSAAGDGRGSGADSTPPPPDIKAEDGHEEMELEKDTLPPYLPAIQGCRSVEEFQCLNR